MRTQPLPLLLACLALAACSDAGAPGAAPTAPVFAVAAPPDLAGEWVLEREFVIHLAEFGALAFGLEPEGKRTTIHCAATGALTLTQDGASFAGSLATSAAVCVTNGGQTTGFSATEEVVQGQVKGQSVSFLLMGEPGPVECPAHGVIADVDGGAATRLRGNWTCIEPGHPKSVWLAPAPRAGPNRTLWEARR